MFACPGLIFYTVCSVPWLNGNLALAEKCSGPLRFRLRQVLLYLEEGLLLLEGMDENEDARGHGPLEIIVSSTVESAVYKWADRW